MSRKRAEAGATIVQGEDSSVATQQPTPPAGEQGELNPPSIATPAADPQHAEANNGEKRSDPPDPNPRSWAHHNQAGVEFRTHRDPYEAELVFQDKPSQAVIDHLKANGFRWNRQEKIWTRPVNFDTQAQDRLVASRTYHKVVGMILEEKGLVAEPEKTPF